jgi:hypothetical protein
MLWSSTSFQVPTGWRPDTSRSTKQRGVTLESEWKMKDAKNVFARAHFTIFLQTFDLPVTTLLRHRAKWRYE